MVAPWFTDKIDNYAWNTLFVDGQPLPGTATIDCALTRDLDVKKVKGQNGANYEDQGSGPVDISIELLFRTQDEWDVFQSVLPAIQPRRADAARSPLRVEHPTLALFGVSLIYVKSIGSPKIDANAGISISIKAIEYNPAPKQVTAGKPKPAKGVSKDPTADFQNALAAANANVLNSVYGNKR